MLSTTARSLLILCWAAVPSLSLLSGTAAAAPDHPAGRPCRELIGRVEELHVAQAEDGTQWIEATVRADDDGEPIRIRVAPSSVLEDAEFQLAVGDSVQVRYVVGERPPEALRIRDLQTGRMLRLRCLHGEPLWGYHHRHRRRGR